MGFIKKIKNRMGLIWILCNEKPIDLPSLTSRNGIVARTKQGKRIRKTGVKLEKNLGLLQN